MRTIKLTISYDGTNYVGWQIQNNGVSVQALVQSAVRQMTGEKNIIEGASRTDAGVHALGQVAHFSTNKKIPLRGFKSGLNSMLSTDIVVLSASEANDKFHSRKSSKGKLYLYRIFILDERSPIFRNRFWQLHEKPDVVKMRKAAKFFVGKHDFASFCASGSSCKDAIRTIKKMNIKVPSAKKDLLAGEGMFIDFTVEGDGFVRHMIRNIVGTLVDVGYGKIRSEDVEKIIEARNRKHAGRCAPACGLYLVKVFY